MADPEDDIARRFTDDPALLAAAEKKACEQGWHQGPNQTVLGIGPVPWWLRKPATTEETTGLTAELGAPPDRYRLQPVTIEAYDVVDDTVLRIRVVQSGGTRPNWPIVGLKLDYEDDRVVIGLVERVPIPRPGRPVAGHAAAIRRTFNRRLRRPPRPHDRRPRNWKSDSRTGLELTPPNMTR